MGEKTFYAEVGKGESHEHNPGRNKLQISVFNSFEDLDTLQQEWDDFMESVGGEIFLTYDWCRIWWKYYGAGREMAIFIVNKKEEIYGILPLVYEKLKLGPIYVRLIRILGTDHVPIAIKIPIKGEFLYDVLPKIIMKIKEKYIFDIIHIGPISGKYKYKNEILSILSESINGNFSIKYKENLIHTFFNVKDSWESQKAELSKNERRQFAKKYERFIKNGVKIESIKATEETFETIFKEFVTIHQERWEKSGYPGHFKAWPHSFQFHKELAIVNMKKDLLRLFELRVDGISIGYSYGYKFGNVYYYFLYARKLLEGKKIIDFVRIDFAELIKRAIKENVEYVDVMQGKYDYKLRLGGQLLPITHILIQSNGFLGKIRIFVARALGLLMNVVYIKIWRNRMSKKIKWKLGKYWELWLKANNISY